MDKTKEKILMNACKLFKKQDFTRVTMKKIAQESGVNEITIFRKFKTKKLLFQAVLDKYRADVMKIIHNISLFDENQDLQTKLNNIHEEFTSYYKDNISLMFTFWSESRYSPEIQQQLGRFPLFVLNSFEFLLTSADSREKLRSIDYRIAGMLFFGFTMFFSLANTYTYPADKQLIPQDYGLEDKKIYEQIVDIFLHGIKEK